MKKNLTQKKANNTITYFPWVLVLGFFIGLPLIWADESLLDASLLSRQFFLSIFIPILMLIFFVSFPKSDGFKFCKQEKFILYGLLTYMAMHIISLANVINGHEALFHMSKEFSFCVFFFLLYQLLKSRYEGRHILIKSVLVSSGIFIAIGVIQLTKADFSKFLSATSQQSYYLNTIMNEVYSTCSNKNLFGSILFLSLPFSVYGILAFDKNRFDTLFWRPMAIVVTTATICFIAILLSRTVFAALFITIISAAIIFYIYIIKINPQKTGVPISKKLKATLIGAPIIIVLMTSVLIATTETKIEQTIKERIYLTINPERYGYKDNQHGESSVAMRTLIWGKTIDMIKEHPLVGMGPGQWQIVIPKYGLDEFNQELRDGSLTFQRPHNDFLWIASEVGIIGALGFILFLVGIIVTSILNIKRAYDKRTITFNILATSTLIGWILISAIDYPHERIEHNVFYLTIASIVLADFIQMQNSQDNATEKKKFIIATKKQTRTNAVILCTCTIICILGIKESHAFYKGEANGRNILLSHYDGNWNKVLLLTRNLDEQEYTLNNYTVPMSYYRGIAYSMKNDDKSAIKEFDKGLELHPYHILTICAKGTSMCNLKQYDESLDIFQQVLDISPRNSNAIYNMAIAYYNKKEFTTARDYILQVPFDPKNRPGNFTNSYVTICKFASIADKELFNQSNLVTWLKDDNRIIATIKKYHSRDSVSFNNILLEELGPKQ